MSRYLTALVIVLVTALGAYAQDTITQDDVDAVASKMFCPVCENEPLDQCYNPTCIQWKREIQDLLGQGMTEREVLTSFVDRYGEHVVGVPQDPFLRGLSFGAPIIATIIAIVIATMTFKSWQQNEPTKSKIIVDDDTSANHDSYRSQIERDIG